MATGTASELQIAPQRGARAHVSARLHSRQLDQALARGTPSEAAAPLALRARRLTTLSRRRVIANGLRRAVRDSCRGARPSHVRVSLADRQVIAASGELTRLADALASPGPVAARGVAEALLLLTDGAGPLYHRNSTASLRALAASAADNLRVAD